MDVLSFILRVDERSATKKLRPLPDFSGKRDEAVTVCSAVPPGFRPAHSGAVRRSKRRNGAHRPALLQGSGQPLGSELQPAPARKPSQPVKLLSLLRCARLLSPSLRLEYSGRSHDDYESSYHISSRFASGAGRFRGISAFFLLFSCYYGMLGLTLYGKEGTPAMGWNGCVFFKKGNP